LWARKANQAFLIEVKSFSVQGGVVVLTPVEHQAASHHRANFLLVVVEDAATSTPRIHVIQNPARVIEFAERTLAQYSAPRTAWLPSTM
jgi:hypothetical protein